MTFQYKAILIVLLMFWLLLNMGIFLNGHLAEWQSDCIAKIQFNHPTVLPFECIIAITQTGPYESR